MSNKLVQIHFDFHGPFGAEMSSQLVELAESINQEPGFIWKIWTENEDKARLLIDGFGQFNKLLRHLGAKRAMKIKVNLQQFVRHTSSLNWGV